MDSSKTEPNFKYGCNFLIFFLLTVQRSVGLGGKIRENLLFIGIYVVCKSAVWNDAILRLKLPVI